jgi:hypothetical protein
MVAVGGAVLVLIIVALLVRNGRTGAERMTPAPLHSADSTPMLASPAPAAAQPPTASGSKPTKRVGRSAAAGAAAPAPAVADAPSRASGSGPLPAPAGSGIRRYAQTWVNVRGDRTRSAPAVGVLNPGDAVTVDSLVRGWYRVLVDGQMLGYVHRSMLHVSRPE